MKMILTVILVFFLSITHNLIDGQFGLQNACPGVFQYQYDQNQNLYGLIKVDRSGNEGRIQLDVELSLGNVVQGYNGKITLADDRAKVINDIMNGKPILYKLHFPAWQDFVPRITKIKVNGVLICSGPRIPVQMVRVLTTINLQHKLSLAVTPVISSSDPTIGSGSFNNILNTQGNPNQPTLNLYDSRVDNFNPSTSQDSNSDQSLNSNNPYNFNPPVRGPTNPSPPGYYHPPGRRPPPDNRPPSGRRPPDKPRPFPENPFLLELSTPQPADQNSDNPVFGRTSESPQVFFTQTTETSPRLGFDNNLNMDQLCGRPIPINSLIYNGHSVPRGAYPWLVAIFEQATTGYGLNYFCSGSLISDRHVVTAAHCMKLMEHQRRKPNNIVCVFGRLNIRNWVSTPGEATLQPESIAVHPDYVTGTANADIAVITFSDPIPFNQIIRPLCLWQGSNDLSQVVGNIGTVVGWGKDENGDITTAEPRQVDMPIVDQFECLQGSSESASMALREIVSRNTFCAGFRNDSGPCNGDSGSAFLLRKNGVFYLRGIVSIALAEVSHNACNLREYVVFTDASKYMDWLLGIMRKTS